MNTVQEQWASFSKMVVPKDAPPVQIQEMRRAFYSGVKAMIRIQWAVGGVSENAGVEMLEGVHDEVKRFEIEVAQGSA